MIPSLVTNHVANISLGIVCPMANESETAVAFVQEVLGYCESAGFKAIKFFVVLDKVSKDNTLQLMQELAQKRSELRVVWAPENQNIVDAYVRGYREALAAGSDWVLEIDAGFSHQPAEIPEFFARMSEGYDCVFGSRFCDNGSFEQGSRQRYLVSRGGTILANLFLGTRLKDMTSGFELFSRPVLEGVLARGICSRGPFFQTEIKAYCRHRRTIEVPIHYRSPSHNLNSSTIQDAFANLWRLFRLRVAGRL